MLEFRELKWKKIATHVQPHIDEVAAIWLLKKFGREKYPGVEIAEIEYWTTGGKTPDGRSAEEWEKEGCLAIGTGGGRFDEHPNGKQDRKEDECAFTLVAKDLNMDDNPVLEKITRFVLTNDLKAASHPFDLAYISKCLHSQFPNNPEKIIEWVTIGLEAKYHEQYQFMEVAKKEFEEKAKIEEVRFNNNFIIKVVTIESDSEQISKFARSPLGCEAGVVIQKKSSGNVQIYSNKKYNLNMTDTAQILRYREQVRKGKLITTDWKKLGEEGKVVGCEEWYFQTSGQMLLNGSLTAPNVPPTSILLADITETVMIGINHNFFPTKFESKCKKGICTSSTDNECPLYRYGLHRCRKIRYEMKNK